MAFYDLIYYKAEFKLKTKPNIILKRSKIKFKKKKIIKIIWEFD